MTHNFSTFPDDIVIPHGIYDVKRNEGYIILETSKDTSELL
ncbi:ISAzo13-like element transposase-related protein [Methanosarcina spelaei]